MVGWEEPSPLTRISSLYIPLILDLRPEPHTRIPEYLEAVALGLLFIFPMNQINIEQMSFF